MTFPPSMTSPMLTVLPIAKPISTATMTRRSLGMMDGCLQEAMSTMTGKTPSASPGQE